MSQIRAALSVMPLLFLSVVPLLLSRSLGVMNRRQCAELGFGRV